MISINIIGRVGKGGASIKTVRDREVLSWSVACDSGYGDNKTTLWFDCALWGARGAKLADMIAQGDRIGVTGTLSRREHDGKTYLKIDASDVTLLGDKRDGGDQPRSSSREQRGGNAANTPPMDSFTDDDIPF